jgi:alpha-L-rhamnosidase
VDLPAGGIDLENTMLKVTHLTCESLSNLLGVDTPRPRFCWQLQSDRRGVLQAAYRIQVSQSGSFGDILWDSQKVASDQSLYVEYAGPAPASRTRYYYRVKAWDNYGNESAWSETAWWEMGILSAAEWKAKWITHPFQEKRKEFKPAYYFRKVFSVTKEVKQVRVYASALGVYEFHLNGQRLGEELFTPGLTEYGHHIQYQVYEADLKPGANCIGVTLGEGWYRGRFQIKGRNTWGKTGAIFLQMHVEYQDGSEELIVTDPTWKVSTGPILRSDIYDGEDYDARLETDWLRPDFDGCTWASARIYRGYPVSRLVAPLGEKVRRIQAVPAQKIFQTPAGDTLVDFGQNLVGWVKLTVSSEAGRQVTIDFAEILDKDGNFYRENYRTARSQIVYTCKGTGQETYEPHFTFFGFRYARIRNYPVADLATLTAVVIHSDLRPTGKFSCSNPLINQLQENIRWGEKGNFLDIPTDCPQRDERLGWTGDAQVFARTAAFNLDVNRFFRKWLKDLAVSHSFTGAVPFWIPATLRLPVASSGWGDAAIIVPWTLYLVYGEKRILADQYASMQKWFRYERISAAWPKLTDLLHLQRYLRRERFVWDSGFHFGDWLAPGEDQKEWMAKKPWIATAYFAHSARLLASIARILGYDQDARRYQHVFEKIQAAFCERFLASDSTIVNGFQTAYVLALEFNLLPAPARPLVLQQLLDNISAHDDHLTTGFLGTPQLNFALSNNDQAETAYRLLLQETCPSWLYPVKLGATTIWERWDGIRPDGSVNVSSVGSDNMVSFNHYAFGAIGDWFYRVVAGLEIDPDLPAYKHILIQPQPGGGLEHAEAEFDSLYGPVKCAWKRKGSQMKLTVVVPPNTSAQVTLPHACPERVITADGALKESGYYRNLRQKADSVVVEVGSGEYGFEWKME